MLRMILGPPEGTAPDPLNPRLIVGLPPRLCLIASQITNLFRSTVCPRHREGKKIDHFAGFMMPCHVSSAALWHNISLKALVSFHPCDVTKHDPLLIWFRLADRSRRIGGTVPAIPASLGLPR